MVYYSFTQSPKPYLITLSLLYLTIYSNLVKCHHLCHRHDIIVTITITTIIITSSLPFDKETEAQKNYTSSSKSLCQQVVCFHLLAIVNNAAMRNGVKTSVWVSAFNSFSYRSRSGIAGSYGNSIINFLKNCQTLFHRSYTILHSHQQCIKDSHFQFFHILSTYYFLFFGNSHPNGCEVVSHCDHCPFLIRSLFFLLLNYKNPFYSLDIPLDQTTSIIHW